MSDDRTVDITGVPIYHAVCEDLGVFPMAMPVRSHAQFMAERRQYRWLIEAQARANSAPSAPRIVRRPKKRGRR